MTELDLFKFVTENSVAMRWDDDVLSAWINSFDLAEFSSLAKSALLESGSEARLMSDGSVWIDLVGICEYYGIDPKRIFFNET